jgi:arsenate reductase
MKRRVLIVCTGNSARSQMAEALLRNIAADRFEAFSAGTHPVGLSPLAVEVLGEIGIDISQQRSKSVAEFAGESFDFIITVCDNARESCPVFPGRAERIHHNFPDPAAFSGCRQSAAFRQVRDLIRRWLEQFVREHP